MSPPTLVSGYRGSWYDEEDPVLSKLERGAGRYEDHRDFMLNTMKKYGSDKMYWNNDEIEVERDDDGDVVVDSERDYSNREMEAMADALLRDYAKLELCRECLDKHRESIGEETGKIELLPMFKDGEPVLDDKGRQMTMASPEMQCPANKRHKWYRGEGKSRGNDGSNPVLFEEHLAQRRRREIYTNEGTPDPNIVSGIYNRVHPQGRKVNTDKQRKEHGASFYR